MRGSKDENPAQVLKIVWKVPDLHTATPISFLTVHKRFAPANIALEKGVHLLSINETKATFIQVDEDCDLFNPRLYPITSLGQTQHAKYLIILPIGYFNEILQNVDIESKRVVWMFHTARCGSTAWVQVFNSLPQWTIFSELQTLQYTWLFNQQHHSSVESYSKSPEFRKHAIAFIKMYLHHVPAGHSVFWKTTTFDNYMIDIISEEFPSHNILVAYRDILPSIKSYHSTFGSQRNVRHAYNVLSSDPLNNNNRIAHTMRAFATNGLDVDVCQEIIKRVKPQTVTEWMTFRYAAILSSVLQYEHNGVMIKSIKYEHLKRDRKGTLTKVFRYLGISDSHIDVAYEALNTDSQQGTWLSRENQNERKVEEWQRSEGEVERCNLILKSLGLPDVDSSINLDMEL